MTPLLWTLAIGVSLSAVFLAPLTFVAFLEQGKSPVEVFTIRGKSVRYVTVWTLVAIAAIVLAGFDGAVECFEVAVAVLCGFIPVCLWRVYFENYDFVEHFVEENKERLRYLLLEGMGMDELRFESISSAVEKAVVEFWRKKFIKKSWTEMSDEEIGKLMFDASIEIATVVAETVGEDVDWTVFAFLREWLPLVQRVRVPERAKKELEGCSIEKRVLNCIAIILANETRDVRETRARLSTGNSLRYSPTAGIVARNSAMSGILQRPNCLFKTTDIGIGKPVYNTDELFLRTNGQMLPCADADLPECVVYTLEKMIQAGYLHVSPNGKVNVALTFTDSFMVVQRSDWNSTSAVVLRPFRYVTSVTRLAGNPAFVIETRDIIGGEEIVTGSRSLEGILKLEVGVHVRAESRTWLQNADVRPDEAGIWGNIADFAKPRDFSVDSPTNLMAAIAWHVVSFWGGVKKILAIVAGSNRMTARRRTSTERYASENTSESYLSRSFIRKEAPSVRRSALFRDVIEDERQG